MNTSRTQEYYYRFTNQIHQTNCQEAIAYIINYNNKNQINQANYQKIIAYIINICKMVVKKR